jgi:hypothetical protein
MRISCSSTLSICFKWQYYQWGSIKPRKIYCKFILMFFGPHLRVLELECSHPMSTDLRHIQYEYTLSNCSVASEVLVCTCIRVCARAHTHTHSIRKDTFLLKRAQTKSVRLHEELVFCFVADHPSGGPHIITLFYNNFVILL